MRILRVAPYFAPAWGYGGPARSIFEACRGIAALGEEIRVLTTSANLDTELDVPLMQPVMMDGVEVWYYPRRFPRRYFRSPELVSAIRSEIPKYDVCHFHTPFIRFGVDACRTARKEGKPYFLTYHGTVDPIVLKSKRLKKQVYWNLYESKNVAGASVVIALTAEEKRQIHLLAPNAPVAVVPNGIKPIDLEKIPPRSFLAQIDPALTERPYLLFLSRLNWKKGLDMLLPAFGDLAKKYPDWKLVLAGPDDGFRETAEGLTKKHDIEGRVVFTGLVEGEKKQALFRHSEAFTLPSYSEGLPTAVVEALMCGRSVVITRTCYMPEVETQGMGWVVEPELEAVRRGLDAAMGNPAEREARAAGARDFAIERYGLESVARRTVELYRRAIASPRRVDLTGY
jgi:glycosyltransferase involved in cell wall biosynthesis